MKVYRCISIFLLMVLFGLTQINLLADSFSGPKNIYCSGEIVEIEALGNGIDAIYFRIDKEYLGKSTAGLQGEVFTDNTWDKLIGKFEVKEEFPGFCYARMSDEVSPVEVGQAVRIISSEVIPDPAPEQKENVWGEIVEIETAGVTEHIYIKIDEKQQVFTIGTIGEIYSDKTMQQFIGKFKILEEFPGFYYAQITEQKSASFLKQVARFSKL